jgi:pantoate kinase
MKKFITFFSGNKIVKNFYFNSSNFNLLASGVVSKIYKNPPIANFVTFSKNFLQKLKK